MKTSSWIYLAAAVSSLTIAASAQLQSFDECAYPGGMPANQKFTYPRVHTDVSLVYDMSIGDGVTYTDICDSACSDLTYGCGLYYNGYGDNAWASILDSYLEGTLQLVTLGECDSANEGTASVTESHSGSGFSVCIIQQNTDFCPPATMTFNMSKVLTDGYVNSYDVNPGSDQGKDSNCHVGSGNVPQYHDMPRWFITEPYLDLWIKDTPVFYTTSLGKEIDFTIAYKQQDTRPTNTTVPPTGWSHNWSSYVHFVTPAYLSDTNSSGQGISMPGSTGPVRMKPGWVFTNDFRSWQAILYTTDNGEDYFNNASTVDPQSGLTLVPAVSGTAAGGFKLIHPDGMVDEYTMTTNQTFSFGLEERRGRHFDTFDRPPKRFHFGVATAAIYCDSSSGNVTYTVEPDSGNSDPQTGEQVGYFAFDALLTSRTDPYGNTIHLFYNSSAPYLLQRMVDYDGNTTTFSYDGSGKLTGVSMPYGRSASFTYNNGQVSSITDAAGMSSSFNYDVSIYSDLDPDTGLSTLGTNVFLTSLTTPYGTNSFDHFEASPILNITNPPIIRHIQVGGTDTIQTDYGGSTAPAYVGWYGPTSGHPDKAGGPNKTYIVTYPNGDHEMYMYRYDSRGLVPSNYPPSEIPSPGGPILDDGSDPGAGNDPNLIDHLLSTRNSFHWNRQQYAALSTTDIQNLSSNDYALATMTHWLESDTTQTFFPNAPENNVSAQASLVREASPDGIHEGLKTWIYHSGQWRWHEATFDTDSTAETILPDGSVRTVTANYGGGLPGTISDTFTQPDGSVGTRTSGYSYDQAPVFDGSGTYSRLSSIDSPTDPVSFSYSSDGSEMDVYEAGGITSYFFNSRHQVTEIKHANGLTTMNTYDGTTHFLTSSVDVEANATTLYSFANGLPNSITTPLGLQLNYTWDNLSRLTQVAFPDGTTIQNNYNRLDLVGQKDRLNNWIYAGYDTMDQPASFTDANGHTTSYSFCSCGSLASITDPLNNTTSFNRDYNGNVTSVSSTDGFSLVYHRNYLGQVTNLVTSSGLNLNYFYDSQGLVTTVTGPAGTLYAATYDAGDRPVSVTNAQGVSANYTFDALGRLTSRGDAIGLRERNTYSAQGITTHYDGLSQTTTYGYDAAGRISTVTDPNNNIDSFTYNAAGQIATLTDGNGHVTSWGHDIYGRMTSKTDGNNTLVETNGYDVNGRLVAHWTPANGLTHYTYDNKGNPQTVSYSSGTGITAGYDALDRLVSMSDAVGSTAFTYQNFGAFQGVLATEDGPWANDTVTRGYANRQPSSLTVAQPSGSWSELYGYDVLSRLHALISPAGSFVYTYNGAGRQIQNLSLSDGLSLSGGQSKIAYTYDARGRLLTTALQHGSTVLDAAGYTYDANDNRLSVTRADGAYVNYGYDYAGQLKSAGGYEPDGLTLRHNENFSYTYDGAGNLSARQNDTLSESFTTDNANELVNVARNNQMTVAGVLNGQPAGLTVNGQAAAVYHDLTFAAPNVSLSDGMNTFTSVATGATNTVSGQWSRVLPASVNLTYDANGNLTSDGWHGYEYDCANDLAAETETNAWRNEFVYDGLGRRRIQKQYSWSGSAWTKTNEVRYVYDGMNVVQERDGNNNPVVSYTRGADMSGTIEGAGGIGGLLARTDANGSAYYHADGNGNVTMLVDASGNPLAKYLYDPYGNTVAMWGNLATANTYRFSSKAIDIKSGLYYYGLRYYEPNLQRWLNQDPIRERGGINLYQFVADNSINKIDPRGLAGGEDFEDELPESAKSPEEQFRDALRNNQVFGAQRPVSPAEMDLERMEVDREAFERAIEEQQSAADRAERAKTPDSQGTEYNRVSHASCNLKRVDPFAAHINFETELPRQTGTSPGYWRFYTRPGQTGVDARWIGPESRNPGFDYAELKPYSPWSLDRFGDQLDNWKLPVGRTQLWYYNPYTGRIYSSGFNF